MKDGAHVRAASWSHPLPFSAEALRLAFHDGEKGDDIIVEREIGRALLLKGPVKGRFRVIEIGFDPEDQIIRSANNAVAASFPGEIPKGWRRFLPWPKGMTWTEHEALAFASSYAGDDSARPPHKWIAE